MCNLQKYLDELLPEAYSEIIMLFSKDDDSDPRNKKIQNYFDVMVRRYGDEDQERLRRGIITRFVEEDSPSVGNLENWFYLFAALQYQYIQE